MTTTAPISNRHDLRVQLPAMPVALVPDAVVERIANLSRLLTATQEAVQAVDAAERGVREAASADDHNLAAALLNGTAEPEPQSEQAQAALKEAETRLEAHRTASNMARNDLAAAAVDHADEWRARLAESHSYAAARFENAVRDLDAASATLTATGEVLAMLDSNPAALVTGHYLPSAWLSEAVQTGRQAASEARKHAPQTVG